MSLLKRDAWKLVCFLLIWTGLQMLGRKFNPFGGVLMSVCFLVLEGYLPYMANQTQLISHSKPFIWFVMLGVILTGLTWLSLPAWVFSALVIVEASIFFLLVMAVWGKQGYSVKPLAAHWGKWLITVVVFYGMQVFVFPFIWNNWGGMAFVFLCRLLVPLVYIAITYGLSVCKK